MKIQRTVKFLLHKRKPGDTTNLSILLRVTLHGQPPFDFRTGCKVNADEWDSEKQRAIGDDNAETNRVLDDWQSKMDEVFTRYELLEKRIPTKDEVKTLFNDMTGKKPVFDNSMMPGFFKVYDKFVSSESEKNGWTDGTLEKFDALKNHLKGFDENLTFESFDESKAQEFLSFLHKKKFHNTTISKILSFLRWFLRWASHNGYYNGNVHDVFKPKLKGISVDSKEIIYLTLDEVKALQNLKFSDSQKSLERIRDVFLFCCFTGLRYSDAKKLSRSDIKDGIIHVVTKKTVDGIRVELNKHSKAIIDKYKDAGIPGNMALPVISNEKMNEKLKDLGKLAKLDTPTRLVFFTGNVRHEELLPKWSLLTTHVARRTFVVTALQLGIAPDVIMRWTGHSSYNAMKPYMAIVDELKKKSMSKFDKI